MEVIVRALSAIHQGKADGYGLKNTGIALTLDVNIILNKFQSNKSTSTQN